MQQAAHDEIDIDSGYDSEQEYDSETPSEN
jgi:hypothetical protein